jgi:hypothetical protein
MGTPVPPGGRHGLPRWTLMALVPLALLALSGLYLNAHWNQIPEKFPVHWGPNGPNRWSTKSFLGVYAELIFGGGLALLLAGMGSACYYASHRSAAGLTTLKMMIAVSCLMGCVFAAIGLMPLGFPGVIVAAVLGPVTIIILVLVAQSGLTGQDEPSAEPGPPLLVPKRFGWGYTFNFRNRYSWIILGGFFGGLGVLVAFLVWATHAQ